MTRGFGPRQDAQVRKRWRLAAPAAPGDERGPGVRSLARGVVFSAAAFAHRARVRLRFALFLWLGGR